MLVVCIDRVGTTVNNDLSSKLGDDVVNENFMEKNSASVILI